MGALGPLVGQIGGGAKAANNQVAPGLDKYTQDRESVAASEQTKAALQRYLQAMQGLAGQARGVGSGMQTAFDQGAAGIRGMGQRATGQVAGVYKQFGQQAESNAGEQYRRALANIQDQQAIGRARHGYSSGDQMIGSGQRADAMYGYNQSLAGIQNQRAQLVGGAMERGNQNQIGNEMSLLGQGMDVRQRAFQLPAGYQQAMAQTQFNTETGPTMLYPHRNEQMALGGGSRNPQANGNPMAEIGANVSGMGGTLLGNAMNQNDPLHQAMLNYYQRGAQGGYGSQYGEMGPPPG